MGAGVAHFYTSYAFPDSQKPRYYGGGAMMSAACLICSTMALVIKYYLKRENSRMERDEMAGEISARTIKGSKAGHGGEAVISFRYTH